MPDASFAEVLQVNLSAVHDLTTRLHARLKTSALPGGASVVNLASMMSFFGSPWFHGYGAAKAAIVQLTRTFAAGWAADGIRVNAVAPGSVPTAMRRPTRATRRSARWSTRRRPCAAGRNRRKSPRPSCTCRRRPPHSSRVIRSWWTAATRSSTERPHRSRADGQRLPSPACARAHRPTRAPEQDLHVADGLEPRRGGRQLRRAHHALLRGSCTRGRRARDDGLRRRRLAARFRQRAPGGDLRGPVHHAARQGRGRSARARVPHRAAAAACRGDRGQRAVPRLSVSRAFGAAAENARLAGGPLARRTQGDVRGDLLARHHVRVQGGGRRGSRVARRLVRQGGRARA